MPMEPTRGAERDPRLRAVRRWTIGDPANLREGDAFVALDVAGHRRALAASISSVPFHEVMEDRGGRVAPAPEVLIEPPTWRGYAFVEVLEWLVSARLAIPSVSRVEWVAGVKSGATGVRRILAARGWEVEASREGRRVRFAGTAPAPGEPPSPATIEAELGGRRLSFESGWGSFGKRRIDEGTRLLYEVAAEHGPVPLVVDVGTGYGPLAVALVAAGHATEALGTDVDSVALLLAGRNARAAAVGFRAAFDDDPARQPPSALTVCNLPTHTDRDNARLLAAALGARAAAGGDVLVVVHASLEQRHRSTFATQGVIAEVATRATHTVLRLTRA